MPLRPQLPPAYRAWSPKLHWLKIEHSQMQWALIIHGLVLVGLSQSWSLPIQGTTDSEPIKIDKSLAPSHILILIFYKINR